jgi:hypothetical protein
MTTIFLELVKAASTVGYQLQTADQTDEQYIKGLAYAIGSIEPTVFDTLSKDAQRWYQQIYEVQKQPFEKWPKIPGFKDDGTRGLQRPQQMKSSRIIRKIREIVMMDPELSARQVQKLLDATAVPGIKFETVSVVVSETKSFIMVARDLGFWRMKSVYEGQEKLSVEEAQTQFPK